VERAADNGPVPRLTPPLLPSGTLAATTQPQIEGRRLVLRPWTTGDVDVLLAAYADPQIQLWHGRSLTRAEAFVWLDERAQGWQEETSGDWAVTMSTAVVGRVSLHRIDLAEGFAEVGYWTLPEARGGGLATAAVALLTDWAFDQPGFHRIELVHSMRNPASCRVAEGAGYPAEGIRRQHTPHSDGWHDMHLHARLASDPPPRW
jgi:RimJ/RimL family protein N-acetyltransferase